MKKPIFNWQNDGVLKILCIGNSFSEDTLAHAATIAKNLGIERFKFGNMMIGGCELNTHAANARADAPAYIYEVNENGAFTRTENQRLSEIIPSDEWDYISLQQASGQSGLIERYGESFTYMVNYVKERMPKNAQIVWNMTWAYQGDSLHGDFPNYNRSQSEMYSRILGVVKSTIYPSDDFVAISPAGTAIQNARTFSLGDTLTRDGFHLSLGVGRFIAGLSFLHTLTGKEFEDVAFTVEGVSEKEKQIAIASVKAAVANPFEVTEINL